MPDVNLSKKFLQLLKPRLPQMLATLRRFVTAESPSLEKASADRCCGVIAAEWNKHATRVERIAQKHRGDLLRITYATNKSRPSSQLLVLGHYDTVYSTGTLAKMPFRVKGGKAYGPGTFDMKAGIVQALFALQALQQAETPLRRRIVFLWTSDEEIGSESSRKIFETEARRSEGVFVLEPSFGPRGLLKTARKGVGEAELIVHGRASHAGLAPQEGITGVFDRPPLDHKMSESLFACAQLLAKEMNLSLGECTVGGGSDGNFTAALGIPTLDGLGAVGDGAHSAREHILINTMPTRAALLAALLATN